MTHPKINPKRFYSFIILMILVISTHCFAGDPLSKSAQENTNLFFESIIKQDYEQAYKYTSGSIRYRSNNSKNIEISNKKEFIKISPLLFNKQFRDVLKSADNFNAECCLNSRYVWGKDGIFIWFRGGNDDATPDVISNTYMIEPSFDCSKAQTAVEKAICGNLSLSNQDQRLKNIYTEAKVFLTGQEYKNLKTKQIFFIKKRESCGNNASCINQITDLRIQELDNLIEKEWKKPIQKFQKDFSDLNGVWKSVNYKSSAYCGKYSDDYVANNVNIEIRINYPLIALKKFVSNEEVKYHESEINLKYTGTFASVYHRTVYSKSYWGSCGGNIFKMPYEGKYILFTSKDGVFVLTGHEGEPKKLIYGDYLIDEILLDEGHLLKKLIK